MVESTKNLKTFFTSLSFSWQPSWSRAYFLSFFLTFLFTFINSRLCSFIGSVTSLWPFSSVGRSYKGKITAICSYRITCFSPAVHHTTTHPSSITLPKCPSLLPSFLGFPLPPFPISSIPLPMLFPSIPFSNFPSSILGLMRKVGGAKGVALKLGERAASHLAPLHSPGDKRSLK